MASMNWLIPPRRVRAGRGTYHCKGQVDLAAPRSADAFALSLLAEDLKAHGLEAKVLPGVAQDAAVRIVRRACPDGPESYRLRIDDSGVEILAGDDAGAYYGVATLRDLLACHGTALPRLVIDDKPDFTRRGIYLDCSRGRVPKISTLKTFIERLGCWKVNELQLYIENTFRFRRHPAIGKGFSPFSAKDLLTLQDHARKHHVRFVGSLASFGHMEKILMLPEYRHLGELEGYRRDIPAFEDWSGGTTLSPADPGSIRLLEELYEEFLPLFDARDFNICGDETWELGMGRTKCRADRMGVGRVYLDFLKKIHSLCGKHGKRMNAWADIVLKHPELLSDLPEDVVMLNWAYSPGHKLIARTKEITQAGLETVVCPGTNGWQSHGCRLAMGMDNIEQFAAEGRKQSCAGMLNTDWGDFGHRNLQAVSLHNLAFGAAAAWNGQGLRQEGFTQRFCRHVLRRDSRDLASAITALGAMDRDIGLGGGNLRYWTHLVPLAEHMPPGRKRFEHLDDADLRKLAAHRRRLEALAWPDPKGEADPFLATTFEEFAAATAMDTLALRRLAAAAKLRRGQSIPAGEVKDLAEQTRRTASQFAAAWRRGNRPSRLRDVQACFRRDLKEYDTLL